GPQPARVRPSRMGYRGSGRLRLFARSEPTAMLAGAGLRPLRWWGIHALTNLIPSTVLHRGRLGRWTAALFRALAAVDAKLATFPPTQRMANSLVVLAEKL